MSLKYIVWLFPFASFLAGYYVIGCLYGIQHVEVPSLVGGQLLGSIKIVSDQNLNIKLLALKPDPDLPEGTVISQIPAPGSKVRPRQSVFVVCSTKPEGMRAPDYKGMKYNACQECARGQGIRLKPVYVLSSHPADYVVAQVPRPETVLDGKTIVVYVSKAPSSIMLVPSLIDLPATDARTILEDAGFSVEWQKIFSDEPVSFDRDVVVDQKPRSGVFVSIEKKPVFKIMVASL